MLAGSARLGVLAGALFVLLVVLTSHHFWAGTRGNLDASGHAIGRDFVIFWGAALAARDGVPEAALDPDRFMDRLRAEMGPEFPLHFWSYPPTALFFVRPFGFRPYLAAFASWAAVTLALLLAACWLFRPGWQLPTAVLIAPSTLTNLLLGQNGYLTGALAVGSWALILKRPWLAGVSMGLLTFKPQLGILMPFALIAMRAWRTTLSACITAAALLAASLWAHGADSWRNFFELTMPFQLRFMHEATGPFQLTMPTVFMSGRLLGFPASASWAFQWLLVIPTGWITYRVFRGTAPFELKLAVLFCATFLACPQLMTYDMGLTSLAAIVLVTQPCRPASQAEVLAAAAIWILPWMGMYLSALGWPVVPLFVVLLLGLLVRRALRAGV